jgi:hypothetical protein
MPTYSVDDIVGKTLIARKPVQIKRFPQNSAPVVYTVPAGQPIGTVYSWVQTDGNIWWMYLDDKGKTYYTKHQAGYYDIKSLEAQGTVALETVQDEQKKSESPIAYYLERWTKPLIWAGVAYIAWQGYLDWEKQNKKTRRR